MTLATDILDATYCPDRPIPAGYTDEWDFMIWNVGHVYRWSDDHNIWLDCGLLVTVKPGMTLGEAYEGRTGDRMKLDYAIFFACDD